VFAVVLAVVPRLAGLKWCGDSSNKRWCHGGWRWGEKGEANFGWT
jgi:CDGSH-type Zn-finger protein